MGKEVKKDYENACNAYLKLFCEKHGYDYDADCWVSDDVGGIACVSDLFVDMVTIRTDIDMDAPEEEFVKWYDYSVRLRCLGVDGTPNFKSWLKGCPRKTEAEIAKIEALHEKVRQAKELLEDAIKERSEDEDS